MGAFFPVTVYISFTMTIASVLVSSAPSTIPEATTDVRATCPVAHWSCPLLQILLIVFLCQELSVATEEPLLHFVDCQVAGQDQA